MMRIARALRHGLALCLLVLLWSCGHDNPIKPDPPTGGGSNNQLTLQGCFLSGGANAGGMATQGSLFFPSGNLLVDSFYQQEGLNLVNTFGLAPRGYYFNDPSPNAFATSEVVHPLGPDGTVAFGINLTAQQLSKQPNGSTVVAIMAHEFGHIAQFKRGGATPGKRTELHADYMAGWYLALRGQYAWTNLSPALKVFYEIGDYQFNSPGHHGTPEERLQSAQAGFSSNAANIVQAYEQGRIYVTRF